MAKKDKNYTLGDLHQQLNGFLQLLDRESVLENFSSGAIEKWVYKSGSPQKLHVVIDLQNPLRFTPVVIRTKGIVADISTSCTRRGPGRLDLDDHSVLVRLWHRPPTGKSCVICRIHVDLANPGQLGPWSHLQVSGRSGSDHERWSLPAEADELRWVSPLYDVIIACELVVYSFWPDRWTRLIGKPEFCALVRRSEEAYIRPFFERWVAYAQLTGSSKQTFLATLCNRRNQHPWQP